MKRNGHSSAPHGEDKAFPPPRKASSVDVAIECAAWKGLDFDPRRLARKIVSATAPAGVAVSVLLTGDAAIRLLNRDYRGQDKPTNVLSFPMGETGCLGDIAIAYETTAREADAMAVPFRDHFIHLLIHGTLHLLGYDHETKRDAKAMELLEISLLAGLGIENPYARPNFMA